MAFSSLYRETILDHARQPRNQGRLSNPSCSATRVNPLCGDELEVQLLLEHNRIAKSGIQVRGCSLAIASASLMTQVVEGLGLDETHQLCRHFELLIQEGGEVVPEALEPMRPFLALVGRRNRSKCLLLAWKALGECLARQAGENQCTD